jgi:hypothetical protein
MRWRERGQAGYEGAGMVRYGGGEGGEEKSGEERDREKGGNIAPRPSDGAKPRYTADRLGWVIFFCSFSFVGKCSVKMGWERGGGGDIYWRCMRTIRLAALTLARATYFILLPNSCIESASTHTLKISKKSRELSRQIPGCEEGGSG